MRSAKKNIPRTKPKTKSTAKAVAKPVANKKLKVKPAFHLKGIPSKFKWICTIVLANATSKTECDELILVGINAFENIREIESDKLATKTEVDHVTQAILTKKATYIQVIN